MTSSYTPGSFSGSIPSATALTNEFAAIKAALDECLQTIAANGGNGMQAELDMNSFRILNAAMGTDPGDVVTVDQLTAFLGNAQTLADLTTAVTDNDADIAQLQSDLIALAATVTAAAGESHEINITLDAGVASASYVAAANQNSENSIAGLVFGNHVTLKWDQNDTSTSADLPNGTPTVAITTNLNGGDVYTYELKDTNGTDLGPGDWEPADVMRFSVQVPAVANGATGELTAQRLRSTTDRLNSVESVASGAATAASSAQTDATSAQSTANTAITNAAAAQTTANTANTQATTNATDITGLTTAVNDLVMNGDGTSRLLPISMGSGNAATALFGSDGTSAQQQSVLDNNLNAQFFVLFWNSPDTGVTADLGNGTPTLTFTEGGDTYSWELRDGHDDPLLEDEWQPGDLNLFIVGIPAVANGTAGIIRKVGTAASLVQLLQLKVMQLRVIPMYVPLQGTPPDATEVLFLPINTPLTIRAGSFDHQLKCRTAPAGGAATFSLVRNGVGIGVISFADGSTDGILTMATDQEYVSGDELSIEAITMNGIVSPTFTFKTFRQDI